MAECPFEMEARELLAKSYWGQYRAEDAIREIQMLATEEPQNETIWGSLGNYLLAFAEIVTDESMIIEERLDAMFSLQALLTVKGDFAAADSLILEFSEALKKE